MVNHKVEVLYSFVTPNHMKCFRIEFIEDDENNYGDKYGIIWIFDEGKAVGLDIDDIDEIDKMIKALEELKNRLEKD